jgi:hypothetical protein
MIAISVAFVLGRPFRAWGGGGRGDPARCAGLTWFCARRGAIERYLPSGYRLGRWGAETRSTRHKDDKNTNVVPQSWAESQGYDPIGGAAIFRALAPTSRARGVCARPLRISDQLFPPAHSPGVAVARAVSNGSGFGRRFFVLDAVCLHDPGD